MEQERKSSAQLLAVVETAVDGVILIDDHGHVLMFNPACAKLFGYAAAEVIGQNVKMLMPEPFHGEHDGYLANYRNTGTRKIIGIGREVTGRRKDGTTFPMDLSVGEAMQDGKAVFVGIIRDLTQRKKSEEALRETASQLRAVVETAVDGVILIDERGHVRMFNPACEKLFGYEAAEVIGQNVKMLMPEPFHGEHDGYLANYRATGERKIIGIGREVTGQRKDGTTFPMHLSVGEAMHEGKAIFVGIIHDLTSAKKSEEQLVQAQKMEAVGQLSGGIAHDFNNLLTVIIGNAELLNDALKARPDLQKLATTVHSAGERGAELTRRLLAFSRRQTLIPKEIDCNQLIDGMWQILRRTIREDIDIKKDIEAGLWRVFADQPQLESALLNLAINSQDAMPEGGNVTLTTSNVMLDERYHDQSPEVPPGRYVMISLTDTGEGMSAEVLQHVFEPFYTTKEVGKGTGLGLSMVYGFVKQSNGHLTIYSEPGLGTTVRIYLPATSAADSPQDDDKSQQAHDDYARSIGSENIMVVEDDMFVRTYAITCLETLGYRVLSAVDGREALALLAGGVEIDGLFTDVVMPGGINGWELIDRARRLRPGLPVLLCSGYAIETLGAHGRLPDDVVFLNKPYTKADLARYLRRALDSRVMKQASL